MKAGHSKEMTKGERTISDVFGQLLCIRHAACRDACTYQFSCWEQANSRVLGCDRSDGLCPRRETVSAIKTEKAAISCGFPSGTSCCLFVRFACLPKTPPFGTLVLQAAGLRVVDTKTVVPM